MGFSAWSVLSGFEAWATGYKPEHLKLGLQMALCFIAAVIPLLIQRVFSSLDRGSSVLYTAITVAVVLEPCTGDSFRKLLKRALGAALAGGIGMLALLCAGQPDLSSISAYNQSSEEVGSWVLGALGVLGFLLMTNHQRYLAHSEFWGTALFALPIVTVPAIRCSTSNPEAQTCVYYTGAAYRMANIIIGIVVAAVVSFFVLPVRARGLLQKKMASTMIKIGDLGVWLLGQVCVAPQKSGAGGPARLPGATGTDDDSLYTDDGLRARLAPLLATAADLTADLAYMGELLAAASAEVYLHKRPRSFPTKQYQNLLDSCHVVMGVYLSLLHSLQSGELTLECCQRHIGDLSEAGVRLSAAFTALSSLIRPLKTKKGGKKGKGKAHGSLGGVVRPGAEEAVAASQAAVAAHNGGAAAGSAAAAGPVEPPSSGADATAQQVASQAAIDILQSAEDDDPFAGLDDTASGRASPKLAALSDSQLATAQEMARHLSRVLALSQRQDATQRAAAQGAAGQEAKSRLGPGADAERGGGGKDGGGGANVGSGGGCSDGHQDGASSAAVAASGAGVGDQERRQWVQAKLTALVDSIAQLERGAYEERVNDANAAGVPAFMLVVHACINVSRQCGACFTALDPQRGAQLHEYFRAARKAWQIGQPVDGR